MSSHAGLDRRHLISVQLMVDLKPLYACSMSNARSLALSSLSSSLVFIWLSSINHWMILARCSKSWSVTLFTDWMTSESRGWSADLETMLSRKASRKVMKFSVAARIRLPDAAGAVVAVVGGAVRMISSTGRPTRSRSLARGHSIYRNVRVLFASLHVYITYIPFP